MVVEAVASAGAAGATAGAVMGAAAEWLPQRALRAEPLTAPSDRRRLQPARRGLFVRVGCCGEGREYGEQVSKGCRGGRHPTCGVCHVAVVKTKRQSGIERGTAASVRRSLTFSLRERQRSLRAPHRRRYIGPSCCGSHPCPAHSLPASGKREQAKHHVFRGAAGFRKLQSSISSRYESRPTHAPGPAAAPSAVSLSMRPARH